jgi:chemotaxis protein MotB
MAEKNDRPIVIKKIKKGGHGHHGGSWKVAYADFVTAMMAFFLLMWLLASTEAQDRVAIANYFQSPLKALFASGGPPGGDRVIPNSQQGGTGGILSPGGEAAALQAEAARFDSLVSEFQEELQIDSTLHAFKDQIRFEITSEGLRIMILDEQNRAMFESGSAAVKPHMRDILRRIADIVNTAPNPISITGHTDAIPYSGGLGGYSNWELSADRANAARRELVAGGIQDEKVMRVEGVASRVPLLFDAPNHASNRRITIILLNAATARAIQGRVASTGAPPAEVPPAQKKTVAELLESVSKAPASGAH